MNWYKITKLASVEFMYHGTGSQNLKSILSEGLVLNKEKNYNDSIDYNTIRSHDGIYLTNSLVISVDAAFNSSFQKNLEDIVVVIVQTELKTPYLVLDEDELHSPYAEIDKTYDDLYISKFFAKYVKNELPNKIKNIAIDYLNNFQLRQYEKHDRRFIDNLVQYAIPYIYNFCLRELSNLIKNETQSEKEEFFKIFPEFSELSEEKAENLLRTSIDVFVKKSRQILNNVNESDEKSIRSLQEIKYSGKNKIVLVAKLNQFDKFNSYTSYKKESINDKDVYKIDIFYMQNDLALQKFIKDLENSSGLKKFNFEIYYSNKLIYKSIKKSSKKEIEL